jgi:catechol 2,3-dioxygenase-like lactoylglutathione lyase family enzyme
MTPSFNLIGLVVNDMSASLAFYRRLGLDIPAGAEGEPHVEVALPGGLRLAWDTADMIKSIDPEWTPPQGGHRVSLAFLCDSPADVDASYADLVAAGCHGHKEPWDAFWGQRYAMIADPDGNSVELFAPLPVGEVPGDTPIPGGDSAA